MASVDSDIDKDWLLTIGDDKYIVTSAGSTMHMMTGSNKIVELEKYKESKKKVG